jgi:hypothetical protein
MSDDVRTLATRVRALTPAESINVTAERSITNGRGASLAASHTASTKSSALARSISPRTETPSSVLSRPHVLVTGKRVYTPPPPRRKAEPTNVCGHPYSLQIRSQVSKSGVLRQPDLGDLLALLERLVASFLEVFMAHRRGTTRPEASPACFILRDDPHEQEMRRCVRAACLGAFEWHDGRDYPGVCRVGLHPRPRSSDPPPSQQPLDADASASKVRDDAPN